MNDTFYMDGDGTLRVLGYDSVRQWFDDQEAAAIEVVDAAEVERLREAIREHRSRVEADALARDFPSRDDAALWAHVDPSEASRPPVLVNDEGAFDVFCTECEDGPHRQLVERRLGAWWCPKHRDRGTVVFERRATHPLDAGSQVVEVDENEVHLDTSDAPNPPPTRSECLANRPDASGASTSLIASSDKHGETHDG